MTDAIIQDFADVLSNHGLNLLGGWLASVCREGWLRFNNHDGAVVWPEEITQLFKRQQQSLSGPMLELPDTLSPSSCWQSLRSYLEAKQDVSGHPAKVWMRLIQQHHLNRSEVQTLALLVALNINLPLLRAYRYGWANLALAAPSWGFVVELLADANEGVLKGLWPDQSLLFRAGLISLEKDHSNTPLAEALLTMPQDVLVALTRGHLQSHEWQPNQSTAALSKRLANMVGELGERLPTNPQGLRSAVYGPRGSGRMGVVGLIARHFGLEEGVWRLDLGRAVRLGYASAAIACAKRISVLFPALIAVQGSNSLGDQEQRWVEAIEDATRAVPTPLIWVLEQTPASIYGVEPAVAFGLGYPSRTERYLLWKTHLGERVDDSSLRQLAGKYLLSEGQIAKTAASYKNTSVDYDDELYDVLARAARDVSQQGLGRLATPESARASFDALIVDEETETALREIVSYMRHRDQLLLSWGFGAKHPYGRGVTCLFAGPPGTGKTWAAQVIATALELELYRVDLSQLVSKYIGETEKHLQELFDAAENDEVLLLFDEADSLFGKRTEVKSSVDRYANLEVNFLLQRMERFEGVTILTTNYESGLDEAFARRIRFRVHFEAPDEETRHRLWHAMLPKEMPVADDVDLKLLADSYELSGGHIKEVALRAGALALGEGASAVTQEILIKSANVEYKKLGKLPVDLPYF